MSLSTVLYWLFSIFSSDEVTRIEEQKIFT
jgi:hypothetical protein